MIYTIDLSTTGDMLQKQDLKKNTDREQRLGFFIIISLSKLIVT